MDLLQFALDYRTTMVNLWASLKDTTDSVVLESRAYDLQRLLMTRNGYEGRLKEDPTTKELIRLGDEILMSIKDDVLRVLGLDVIEWLYPK